MLKLPFNNPSKAIVGILLVIGLFVAYESCSATELEVGPTFTGEFNGGLGLVLMERVHPNIDVGIALISDQEWDGVQAANNGNAFAAFVAERPDGFWRALPDEMHIGASMWIKDNPPINGCRQGYLLGLKYRLGDNFSVGVRHWSNAGTCKPNRGQDLLTFGWRF